MSKQEWFISSVVTVLVAAVTVVLMIPSIGWAGQEALVTIPELPSSSLKIPSINAEVSATAETPEPGKAVKVILEVKSGEGGGKAAEVPVTVTILSTTGNPMSRTIAMPKQVTQVVSIVTVDSGGNGSAVVELPLEWAEKPSLPEIATSHNKSPKPLLVDQDVTTYQIALSSELNGEAVPNVFMLSAVTKLDTTQINIKQAQNGSWLDTIQNSVRK